VIDADDFVDESIRTVEALGLVIRYRERAKPLVVRAFENL
jgi:hypothetical protein